MTDPIQALADAARELSLKVHRMRDNWSESDESTRNELWSEVHIANAAQFDALVAYDAAQEKRQETERIVEAGSLPSHLERAEERDAAQVPPSDAEIEAWAEAFDEWAGWEEGENQSFDAMRSEAIRLMRRARPEPAPSDAEIEAWRKDIDYARIHASRNRAVGEPGSERLADEFRLSQIIEDGIRLMRRARPDDGLLRAAKRIVEADWATLFSTKKCDAAWRGLVPIKAADLIDDLRAEVARVEGK